MQLSPRQIATLWIIGIAGTAIIIYDHRVQALTILNALNTPQAAGKAASGMMAAIFTPQGTNDPIPDAAAGRNGVANLWSIPYANTTSAFGSIWDSLSGGSIQ